MTEPWRLASTLAEAVLHLAVMVKDKESWATPVTEGSQAAKRFLDDYIEGKIP